MRLLQFSPKRFERGNLNAISPAVGVASVITMTQR
jgi:hypothetical protein